MNHATIKATNDHAFVCICMEHQYLSHAAQPESAVDLKLWSSLSEAVKPLTYVNSVNRPAAMCDAQLLITRAPRAHRAALELSTVGVL